MEKDVLKKGNFCNLHILALESTKSNTIHFTGSSLLLSQSACFNVEHFFFTHLQIPIYDYTAKIIEHPKVGRLKINLRLQYPFHVFHSYIKMCAHLWAIANAPDDQKDSLATANDSHLLPAVDVRWGAIASAA